MVKFIAKIEYTFGRQPTSLTKSPLKTNHDWGMSTLEQLAQFLELPDEELCQQAKTMRRRVDRSLWELGLYLIAIQQRQIHRARACSGVIQFAVRYLDLAQQKAYELLRATTSLLETPLLAEAFRDGRVSWGKVREITRVSTSADEAFWLDYALHHDCDEVQRRVAVSPRRYKAQSRESDKGSPEKSSGSQATVGLGRQAQSKLWSESGASEPESTARQESGRFVSSTPAQTAISEAASSNVQQPPAARIKVVFYLTPEELAVYERAEDRVRSLRGSRLSRNRVLMDLAEHRLIDVSSQARARLPILVRVDAGTGQGWFDTRQGLLPATCAQIEEALTSALAISTEGSLTEPRSEPPQPCPSHGPANQESHPNDAADLRPEVAPTQPGPAIREARPDQTARQPSGPRRSPRRRRRLRVATIRALMLRSGGKCEKPGCNRGGALHVHHQQPVCEGGQDGLADLRLYCSSCHSLEHEPDFERKPDWRRARENKQARRAEGCDSS